MTTQRRRKPRNPREVLEAIAFDPDAPAHARVAAAKALLQLAGRTSVSLRQFPMR